MITRNNSRMISEGTDYSEDRGLRGQCHAVCVSARCWRKESEKARLVLVYRYYRHLVTQLRQQSQEDLTHTPRYRVTCIQVTLFYNLITGISQGHMWSNIRLLSDLWPRNNSVDCFNSSVAAGSSPSPPFTIILAIDANTSFLWTLANRILSV